MKRLFTLLILSFSIYSVFGQLSDLNDEFNSPCNLNNWQNIDTVEGWLADHLEAHDVATSYPGQLMMMPYTSSWFRNWRGTLLFKNISGNFIYTTRITTTNRNGDAVPPSSDYSLAGQMIRIPTGFTNAGGHNGNPSDWSTGNENYVFASMGRADDGSTFQVEIKTTQNSGSSLSIQDLTPTTNTIYMRTVKIDSAIIVLSSIDNNTWQVRNRYYRTDFHEEPVIQAGFVTYTDWPNVQSIGFTNHNFNILNNQYNMDNGTSYSWNPDIIGRFHFARFEEAEMPTGYTSATLANAPASELRTLFGHPSISPMPEGNAIWDGSNNSSWSNGSNWVGNNAPNVSSRVVIVNCNCAEVNTPETPQGSHTISSLFLEEDASLMVPAGSTLIVDLSDPDAFFRIEGNIHNYGNIQVTNSDGKEVLIGEDIYNYTGSTFTVQE